MKHLAKKLIIVGIAALVASCDSATVVHLGDPTGLQVIYQANGAAGRAPVDPQSYLAGDTAEVAGSGSLSFPGKTFEGWNTAPGGGGISYLPGDLVVLSTSNLVLYAQWRSGLQVSVQSDVAETWSFETVSLTASASGGSGSYSYQWSDGQGWTDRGAAVAPYISGGSVVSTMVYTCTATDALGRQGTASVSVRYHPSGTVRFINHRSVPIYRLYLSPTTSDTWGNDLLGTSILPVDGSFRVTGLTLGSRWNLKVDDGVLYQNGSLFSFLPSSGQIFQVTLTGSSWTSSWQTSGVTRPQSISPSTADLVPSSDRHLRVDAEVQGGEPRSSF